MADTPRDRIADEAAEQISQGGKHGVSTQRPRRRRGKTVGEAPDRHGDAPEPSETTANAPDAGPSS